MFLAHPSVSVTVYGCRYCGDGLLMPVCIPVYMPGFLLIGLPVIWLDVGLLLLLRGSIEVWVDINGTALYTRLLFVLVLGCCWA